MTPVWRRRAGQLIAILTAIWYFQGVEDSWAALPDHAPLAQPDEARTTEDRPVTINVAANDTDPDGDLDVSSVDLRPNMPGRQTEAETSAGVFRVDDFGNVTFTPAANLNGQVVLPYAICSRGTPNLCSSSVITIIISPANDAPVATDDQLTVPTSKLSVLAVLANDADVDGDPLAVAWVTQPAQGTATPNPDGTITYVPEPNACGTDSFTYVISDGQEGSLPARVTLTFQDDSPPVIVETAEIRQANDDQLCSARVSVPTPAVADNCDAQPFITGSRPDGLQLSDPFPVGFTAVTWTARDNRGNVTTWTQPVIVDDKEAPMVRCRDVTLELNFERRATITAEQIDAGSTDNCGITALSLDQTEFGIEDAGLARRVALTAVDQHGNAASCVALIKVESPAFFSINDVSLNEGESGTSAAVLTVTLSNPIPIAARVDWSTVDGTAAAPADYVQETGSLIFPAGVTNQTIRVRVNGDTLAETDENFSVRLSSPEGAKIGKGEGKVTIVSDDPVPVVVAEDLSVAEGDTREVSVALLRVRLSNPSDQTTTLNWRAVESNARKYIDFLSFEGQVVFLPGETEKEVPLSIVGNALSEADKQFFINFFAPDSPGSPLAQARVTILNDDIAPRILIDDTVVIARTNQIVTAKFRVSLSRPSGEWVKVEFETRDGTAHAAQDFIGSAGTILFAPSVGELDPVDSAGTGVIFKPGESAKIVEVQVLPNTRIRPDLQFFMILKNPAGGLIEDAQGTATILNNVPVPVLSISDADVFEGQGGQTEAVLTLMLSQSPVEPVTVSWATENGSAIAPNDFAAGNGTVRFEPGVRVLTVTNFINGDLTYEPDEMFAVNLGDVVNATFGKRRGVVTILNDDPLPGLSINDARITEGTGRITNVVQRVSLSAPSSEPVAVNWETVDGTASAPGDYLPARGTLTFEPGVVSLAITNTVNGDFLNELNETFSINLSEVRNATLARAEGIVTIVNDDAPPVVNLGDAIAFENDQGKVPVVQRITLSTASGREIRVNWRTGDGTATAPSDYIANGGEIVLSPGVVSQPITNYVNGDRVYEGNETFSVLLSNPENAMLGKMIGLVTIRDDDPMPTLSILGATVVEPEIGSTDAVFQVSLEGQSALPVSVDFATEDMTAVAPGDYQAKTGKLTFGISTVSPLASVGPQLAISRAGSTIQLAWAPDRNAEIEEAEELEGPWETIPTPLDGSKYSFSPAITDTARFYRLVLRDPAAGAIQEIRIPVLADSLPENEEKFLVRLLNPENARLAVAEATGTIVNRNQTLVTVADATVKEGDAGQTECVFRVSLLNANDQTVTVNWRTADGSAQAGSDYIAGSGSLTFPPGVLVQSITNQIIGDLVFEQDESFSVVLTSPVNAILAKGQGVATIVDDDPQPRILMSDVTVMEGSAGAVFEVRLSGPSAQKVSLRYQTVEESATSGGDYRPVSGALDFAPGETLHTVSVPIIDDRLAEDSETFQLELRDPTNVLAFQTSARATILDNDEPVIRVSEATVAEGNSGTSELNLAVTLSNPSVRAVTVRYATTDSDAQAGADYSAVNGTLRFEPGETTNMIILKIVGDTVPEPTERFFVVFSDPVNATLLTPQAVVTITDSDVIAKPPKVSIGSPSDGERLPSGGSLLLSAEVTPGSYSVASVEFFANGALLGQADAPPYQFSWDNPSPGNYALTARVTDTAGLTAQSAPVAIEVIALDNRQRVAVIRNFADPEIATLQSWLADLDLNSRVFDQEGLTFESLQGFDLVIWDDLGAVTNGLTDNEVTMFEQLYASGVPLYFIGGRLGAAGSQLSTGFAQRWMELTHQQTGAPSDVADTLIQLDQPLYPVVNGPFGVVGAFALETSLEPNLPVQTGELLLASAGRSPALLAFENPGLLTRTVTQNFLAVNGGGVNAAVQREKLFKDAVWWLLRLPPVPPFMNVSLDVDAIDPEIAVGSEFPVVVNVHHTGEIAATGVVLILTLPPNVSVVNAQAEGGNCVMEGREVICFLPELARGAGATATLTVRATGLGPTEITASVSEDQPEAILDDNAAAVTFEVMKLK